LPAVALLAAGLFAWRVLFPFYINHVPAMYMSGLQLYQDAGGPGIYNMLLIGTAPAFAVLSYCPWIVYRDRKMMLSKSMSTLLEHILDPYLDLFRSPEEKKTPSDHTLVDGTSRTLTHHCRRLPRMIYVTAMTVVNMILGFMFSWSVAFWGLWVVNPGLYIYKAYLRHDADPSMSCFLMPCSPQSIKDEDQVWSVFAGLFSFVACEVIVPAYKEFKRRSREEKEFVKSVEGALKQDRERRSVPEHTSGVDDAVELAELRRRATGP
jgi:hypothetical protein